MWSISAKIDKDLIHNSMNDPSLKLRHNLYRSIRVIIVILIFDYLQNAYA